MLPESAETATPTTGVAAGATDSESPRPPMAVAVVIDDHHFLHHPVVRKVGPAARDLRIVQRQVRELLLAVPPGQLANLRRADAAMAVVDDDVAAGPFGRRRQAIGGIWAGGIGHDHKS